MRQNTYPKFCCVDLTGLGHPSQVGGEVLNVRALFQVSPSETKFYFNCVLLQYEHHISKNWRYILPHMSKSVLDRCDNLHLPNKDIVDKFHKMVLSTLPPLSIPQKIIM